MAGSVDSSSFALAFVPGVTPGKWVRIWNERMPETPLKLVDTSAADAADLVRRGEVDAVLLRLPTDRSGLHAIPLYTETTVVVVPKDHLVATAEEISTEDLADEIVLHPLDDALDWEGPPGLPAVERPATTGAAIELVAAGVGLLVVPQSLARLHHRKDLTYRPVTDAPQSRVALSWPEEETTDVVEEFIGVVRGRTVNSTRGRRQEPAPAKRERSGGDGKKPSPARKPARGKARPNSGGGKHGKPGKPGKPRRRP
ncbi:LysR family transcriptional regulator substrate-binding protein [Saccharopolyspora sp. NFXS83]|uniref:LysR family transcriptional regulator substrate-binding protein n=1 Tax=Saccharopolyspora sp. NFXS83 TaxID=2993560 RepID=UPI00224B56C9|nr:LysR family transcriptional regulator substrate-binding protein [Saccharopolyspora sp. NFXS83]MCX2729572.1 LysR family transcriptional regulator substrate-binding protein [Saccharopolyspora sp. NFXS83]